MKPETWAFRRGQAYPVVPELFYIPIWLRCGFFPFERDAYLEIEIEKFIIRQPPIGGKDDYDSENSWILDGLPSNGRKRRRGGGRWEVGEWREK